MCWDKFLFLAYFVYLMLLWWGLRINLFDLPSLPPKKRQKISYLDLSGLKHIFGAQLFSGWVGRQRFLDWDCGSQ